MIGMLSFTTWLEPWGEDYGMLPAAEFELIAFDAGERFHFHVVSEEEFESLCRGKHHPNRRLRKSHTTFRRARSPKRNLVIANDA